MQLMRSAKTTDAKEKSRNLQIDRNTGEVTDGKAPIGVLRASNSGATEPKTTQRSNSKHVTIKEDRDEQDFVNMQDTGRAITIQDKKGPDLGDITPRKMSLEEKKLLALKEYQDQ